MTITHTNPADGPVLNLDGTALVATSVQTAANGAYLFSGRC